MTSTVESKNMSSSVSSKVDCNICAEEVTRRKILKCPFCSFESCRSCVEQFLMGIDDIKPRCMDNDCKKVWNGDFMAENFTSGFYNKKYLNRRAAIIHEREKSLLPGTQGLVQQEKLREKNQVKINDLQDEIGMYRELIKSAQTKIKNLSNQTRAERKGIEKKESTFTRACPVEDCRGFLSTGLKCGICSTHACADCHLPKAAKYDADHKCDPDLVATVKLLSKDTKPCPACATPIHKIHGCDQMYCTQCHTAFSWNKGTIERGVVHNPHFYEFQRAQNGGVAPRNYGDMRCGGPPSVWALRDRLMEADVVFDPTYAHMLIGHINNIELRFYPNNLGEMDNSTLRVDYLMKRIDEKQWISKIKAQMKKQEKNAEFHMVLVMFTTTLSDLFGNIISTDDWQDIPKFITGIHELRLYTNNALKKIGTRYGNVYPYISEDFKFRRNSLAPFNPLLVRRMTIYNQDFNNDPHYLANDRRQRLL